MFNFDNNYQNILRRKFKDLFNHLIAINGKKLCIMLSGGSDSMALLFLTKFFIDKYCLNIDFLALTINHSLRENSLLEAKLITKILSYYNIKHYILTWNRNTSSTYNIQCKARYARYNISSTWCLNNGINYAMTAHHLGDQAETVLMRLFRGSGVSGLCGVGKELFVNDVVFLRPLLSVYKNDLYDYLFEIGIPFLEDYSNFSYKYERTKYRFLLDELNKNFINLESRLSKVANLMSEANDFIEDEKRKLMASIVFKMNNDVILLKNVFLHQEILIIRILHDIILDISGLKLSSSIIVNILSSIKLKNSKKRIVANCIVKYVKNDILIYKECK